MGSSGTPSATRVPLFHVERQRELPSDVSRGTLQEAANNVRARWFRSGGPRGGRVVSRLS